MLSQTSRRKFLGILTACLRWIFTPAFGQWNDQKRDRRRPTDFELPTELAEFGLLSLVLGRVSDRSVTVSALAKDSLEGYFEYGTVSGHYEHKTRLMTLTSGTPAESVFDQLKPNTQYFYRMQSRKPGEPGFHPNRECRFHTQRLAGSSFTFAIQGDSHPERPQMSDPALYARTLLNAAAGNPDFYICMGDDFSVAPVHTVNAETVGERYILQRPFLGLVARSAPLFLLNGNHEQASLFNYHQTDERHEVAVLAQNARNLYYPTPAPDRFYSGDNQPLNGIGLLKDYCAWTWGDALFVILDNYWQSPAQVDSGFHEEEGGGGEKKEHGGHRDPTVVTNSSDVPAVSDPVDHEKKKRDGHKNRDWWGLTLGDAQYHWFIQTLESSKAKYKFVFAHHVLGSGRGGVDVSDLYEWGGHNKRGDWEFAEKRPGWELPIHQLMVKHGVTHFFQGHDHLFARQERDGIVYQEVPMPADPFYQTRNENRYESGVKLPNSGYLRVMVSPEEVKVDYVRCYLPKDETEQQKSGDIAHSYTIKSKGSHV